MISPWRRGWGRVGRVPSREIWAGSAVGTEVIGEAVVFIVHKQHMRITGSRLCEGNAYWIAIDIVPEVCAISRVIYGCHVRDVTCIRFNRRCDWLFLTCRHRNSDDEH